MNSKNTFKINYQYFFENFIEALKRDNEYPKIKTEVVYDTLLTDKTLEQMVSYECDIKAKFLTKEFIILENFYKKNENNCQDYNETDSNRGVNADFMMYNKMEKKIYIVELKTSKGSFEIDQLYRYLTLMYNSDINNSDRHDNKSFKTLLDKLYGENSPKHFKTGKYSAQWKDIAQIGINELKRFDLNLIYIAPQETIKTINDYKNEIFPENAKKDLYKNVMNICKYYSDKIHLIDLNSLANKFDNIDNEYKDLKMFVKIWMDTHHQKRI